MQDSSSRGLTGSSKDSGDQTQESITNYKPDRLAPCRSCATIVYWNTELSHDRLLEHRAELLWPIRAMTELAEPNETAWAEPLVSLKTSRSWAMFETCRLARLLVPIRSGWRGFAQPGPTPSCTRIKIPTHGAQCYFHFWHRDQNISSTAELDLFPQNMKQLMSKLYYLTAWQTNLFFIPRVTKIHEIFKHFLNSKQFYFNCCLQIERSSATPARVTVLYLKIMILETASLLARLSK